MLLSEGDYKRIIVIGDLHGILEPLVRLLEKIEATDEDLLIFIGDYIDRGPDSKELVDRLLELKAHNRGILFLKGNHEDMLLGSIGVDAVVKDVSTWLYNGGTQTLSSYGMLRREILRLTQLWDDDERFRMIRGHVPPSHIDFFLSLLLYVETERFFICHAGVSPSSSIEEGKTNTFDLLWMRDHIHADAPGWEKTVVCGHTPQRVVLTEEKVICIDTGLYCYGVLSAIDLLSMELYQVENT